MNTVRTTIVLPENVLKAAKIAAVEQNKPLSKLIAESLQEKLSVGKNGESEDVILKLIGKYSLGIEDKLSRAELYDEHTSKKISD